MKIILLYLILGLSVTACSIDNFEMPELTVSGKIVDSQTGELMESGGINTGSVVHLYEGGSNQPIILQTFPEGNFNNSRTFAGTYSYTAIGPFTLVNAERETIEINDNVEIEIQVVPHVRLKILNIEVNGTTAKVRVQYEKVNLGQSLSRIGIAWSTYRNPNTVTNAGGGLREENVESLNLTSGTREFTMTNLSPNTKYFIRPFARTNNSGNYYNYGSQVEQQMN